MTSSITGFAELADDLEDAAEALEDADTEAAMNRGVETASEQVVEDAQRNAPVDTGELRERIDLLPQIRALERTVVAAADHSAYVEYGTSPHIIRPDEAQALRFQAGGETVFATRVEHPGTAPQPFLRPALNDNRSTLKREIQDELRAELRRSFARH